MWIDDDQVDRKLERLARRLARDGAEAEEMAQVARIHLASLERQEAKHEEAWYVQACSLHLRNWLRQGRSVDSLKRRRWVCPLESLLADDERTLDRALVCDRNPAEDASREDLIQWLRECLSPAEFELVRLLEEGCRDCEIARRQCVSHATVLRRRRALGELVRRVTSECG